MRFQIRPTAKRSLFLLWASHLMLDFFTGIWPIYKTMAQVDLAQAGLIAGLSGFFGEFTQVFFGYFSDRGLRKKMMMLGLALSTCVLGITFTEHIGAWFVLLLFLMIGSGSFHPAAAGFTALLSKERKGRNILLFASGGALGLGISQLAFTRAFQLFNGSTLIFLIPMLILLCTLALYPFQESPQNRTLSIKEFLEPMRCAKRPLLLLYLAQVANFTLWFAFIFLLPDLMRVKGCHPWFCTGGGHLSFILGAALLMIPTGYLCDKYGHKPVLLAILFIGIALFYSFLSTSHLTPTATILILACLGGCMGTISPTLVSWGNKVVPESPSTVSALLMGFAWCLSNLGATWAGLLAKTIEVEPVVTSLSLMGLLLALSFCLVFFIPREQPERLAARDNLWS